MATIWKLRGRWQAQVRRLGMKPRAKSFDSKDEAERWVRDLEAQVDRCGSAPDTRVNESTTLGAGMERYTVLAFAFLPETAFRTRSAAAPSYDWTDWRESGALMVLPGDSNYPGRCAGRVSLAPSWDGSQRS